MYRAVLEEIVDRPGKRSIAVERYRATTQEEVGAIEFAEAMENAIKATRRRKEREVERQKRTQPAGSKP